MGCFTFAWNFNFKDMIRAKSSKLQKFISKTPILEIHDGISLLRTSRKNFGANNWYNLTPFSVIFQERYTSYWKKGSDIKFSVPVAK